jgi:hypothetical protein
MKIAQVYVIEGRVEGYLILDEPFQELIWNGSWNGFSADATCIIVDNHLETTDYYEWVDGALVTGRYPEE